MRSRVVVLALSTVFGLVLLAGAAQARPAPVGQDPIEPGTAYAGDFPDPAVLRIGAGYYAYSTTSYGLNVPMVSSSNLRTWKTNAATATNPTGDALPRTAVWSAGTERKDGRYTATTWAPSVVRLGPHRFVMAYATRLAGQRMCISIASATSPYGPFVDTTTKPTICPSRGAIDPMIYLAPSGRPWIAWKQDFFPAQLFTSRMTANGLGVEPGTRHFLTGIRQDWEGRIIENPAMIRFKGRYYLFYSANSYASTKYAIGYLVCKTWYGGCTRPRKTPLMATGKYFAGPGGPYPFVDAAGKLRVGYHAWRVGAVGYPSTAECRETPLGCGQRRLYVATLSVTKDGLMHVAKWN
jgi:beta-xylosidase